MTRRRDAIATLERLNALAEAERRTAVAEAAQAQAEAADAHEARRRALSTLESTQGSALEPGRVLDLTRLDALRGAVVIAAERERLGREALESCTAAHGAAIDALATTHREAKVIGRAASRARDAEARVDARRDEHAVAESWRAETERD